MAAQESQLQQAADTLLQLSKKRKLDDDLVFNAISRQQRQDDAKRKFLETNSEIKTAMFRRHDAYKAALAVSAMPAAATAVPGHALSPKKYVTVPEEEWTTMCVNSSKMKHLIHHQLTLLQTFLPGKSDTEIVKQAMSECKCVKTRM